MRKFKAFQAPLRFVFKDPDTAHAYSANSKQLLVDQILSYREQNRLPLIPNLLDVLENYWCGLPENEGSCEPLLLTRGWLQYFKGGVALLENVFYGKENLTSDEEAERRAKICLTCSLNYLPKDPNERTGFIKWSDDLAEHSTYGKFTSVHHQLGNCLGCSCTLKAKVFLKAKLPPDTPFDLSTLESETMRQANPSCWQLPENNQS